jgi:aryl-alcohol dehydrogenase-like predicted oxidoreductase
MPFLQVVRKWSEKKEVTMVQFALAWLLAQKPFIVPIPGTTSPQHLKENLGALNINLTSSELSEIRKELESFSFHGVRTAESAFVDQ